MAMDRNNAEYIEAANCDYRGPSTGIKVSWVKQSKGKIMGS